MSLEFERVQKLMSNFPGKVPKWEEAGPAPHGGWEEEDFGGRACSPGCEWDNGAGFLLGQVDTSEAPGIESFGGVPAQEHRSAG